MSPDGQRTLEACSGGNRTAGRIEAHSCVVRVAAVQADHRNTGEFRLVEREAAHADHPCRTVVVGSYRSMPGNCMGVRVNEMADLSVKGSANRGVAFRR